MKLSNKTTPTNLNSKLFKYDVYVFMKSTFYFLRSRLRPTRAVQTQLINSFLYVIGSSLQSMEKGDCLASLGGSLGMFFRAARKGRV